MKTRFDGLDVLCMCCHLERTCLGGKVLNIYDGGDNNDVYILKLDVSTRKEFLVLHSGIRFHDLPSTSTTTTTTTMTMRFEDSYPSPFCSKLRKHLKGMRLESIRPLGGGGGGVSSSSSSSSSGSWTTTMDRVVCFTFLGTATGRCHIILELYAKGNLVLTDGQYEIRALLRSHLYQTQEDDNNNDNKEGVIAVRVGSVYPVTYATTTTTKKTEPTGILAKAEQTMLAWIRHEQQQQEQQQHQKQDQKQQQQDQKPQQQQQPRPKKQKKGKAWTVKSLLLCPSSGVSQYGPALLEHVILGAGLSPSKPLPTTPTISENEPSSSKEDNEEEEFFLGYSRLQWQRLREALQTEAPAIVQQLQTSATTEGYIVYRNLYQTQPQNQINSAVDEDSNRNSNSTTTNNEEDDSNKIFTEFHPYLFRQHESNGCILQRENFGHAVAEFFAHIQNQKQRQKALQAEQAAANKLQKIEMDQKQRLQQLNSEIELSYQRALAVQTNATAVDQAIAIINSALDSGMDWQQLHQLVQIEQQQHRNHIALLIHQLKLEHQQIILNLTPPPPPLNNTNTDEPTPAAMTTTNNNNDNNNKPVQVTVSLEETAHANASRLFAQYRAIKEKSRKTMDAAQEAFQAAQAAAQRQLEQQQQLNRKQHTQQHQMIHKKHWFQKFHWMITRDNYLVLAGKDAHQNELLVKRYLRPGDAYLHADVHGAASCILRAKRIRRSSPPITTTTGTASTSTTTTTSVPLPLSEQALQEAGQFTLCHSSAWTNRIITSAWWVESHQVSKSAPTGEYLTGVGSFMIRGKKHYLPPFSCLEMGLAICFRLGNAESIERHKNMDRKDYMLIQQQQQLEEEDARLAQNNQALDKSIPEEESANHDDDDKHGPPDNTTTTTTTVDVEEKENPPTTINDDHDNVHHSYQTTSTPPSDSGNKKKKGLSIKDRKLIKRYGSLEEAERVQKQQEEQQPTSKSNPKTLERSDTTSSAVSSAAGTEASTASKRGKKSKLKRQKKKYADQDDEDRKLALLLLQGNSGNNTKNNNNKGSSSKQQQQQRNNPATELQEQVRAATTAALVKDSKQIVESLPEQVQQILAQCCQACCLAKDDGDGDDDSINDNNPNFDWNVLDSHVLEQLVNLQLEEAQLAAVTRLLELQQQQQQQQQDLSDMTTRAAMVGSSNITMSLAGILRTIRKHGHEQWKTNNNNNMATERNNDAVVMGRSSSSNNTYNPKEQHEEDNMIVENDDDEIDDTAELAKLTGKPLPEDELVCAIPVCAPYASLTPQYYQYRVKLTPGNGKRGKAAKQCVELLLKQTSLHEMNHHKKFIQLVSDNDWVQAMISNVKIASPSPSSSSGSNNKQSQKSNKGGGGNKKK